MKFRTTCLHCEILCQKPDGTKEEQGKNEFPIKNKQEVPAKIKVRQLREQTIDKLSTKMSAKEHKLYVCFKINFCSVLRHEERNKLFNNESYVMSVTDIWVWVCRGLP